MTNSNYELYIKNRLDMKFLNNIKILYASNIVYRDILVNYNNKRMIDFMTDYLEEVLSDYYNKEVYSNNSIIYLLRELIYFMETSEIYLNFDISTNNRKKLDKYIRSNKSEYIVKDKDVKSNKSLEIMLLLEMGLYNLVCYFKRYKSNIRKTVLFAGNEEEFYRAFMVEIEPQLRSIINSLNALYDVDDTLGMKINDDMINDINSSIKVIKKCLKELV